jgi:hypothetical protein
MKKDPYFSYTDYWPCKPAVHEVCWVVPVLVLVAVIAVCYGAALLTILGG